MAEQADQVETLLRNTFATASGGKGSASVRPCYLAVFEEQGQFLFQLPLEGEVVIGRGEEAAVLIHDPLASRRHARIVMRGDTAELSDLGSQNGTRVAGSKVCEPRPLLSGDLIEIGQTALVFHRPRGAIAAGRRMPFEALRAWLDAQLQQAVSSNDPLRVVSLRVEQASAPARQWCSDLPFRAWCEDPDHGVLAVLDVDPTLDPIDRLKQSLRDQAEKGRVLHAGTAGFPEDGTSADDLLIAARQASMSAGPGEVTPAAPVVRCVDLGAEQVLLADPAMLRVYDLIERLGRADLPVLILGETGTGKELAARAVHVLSPRESHPFVALNCAALTETMVESELFGHEKGAFTGAVARRIGLLEAAHGGTVFLDEVAELAVPTQAKLLRALDTKRIMRVGGGTEHPIDVRVVAATNRDLATEVQAGRFRRDLCFRLTGAVLWLPPLRDRPRELAALTSRFVEQACGRLGREAMTIPASTRDRIAQHPWPGNVRELRNVIEYCAAAFPGPRLEPWQVSQRLQADPASGAPAAAAAIEQPRFRPLEQEVQELESARLSAALEASQGNQTRAAALLSMPLRTFINKMNRYGLRGA
ncbi:MAG: sigma 54-interacting transcriptional regulator [Deltaproteobacteria bacterium]|nr:sigma 54-interacting transcriptional regulator [Deltaproteobacteria bacterium]